MPTLKLINQEPVTITLQAENARHFSGASMASGADNQVVEPNDTGSQSIVSWTVPAERGTIYFYFARVAIDPGSEQDPYYVSRTVSQQQDGGVAHLPPASKNPKRFKLRAKTSAGEYRLMEPIELV